VLNVDGYLNLAGEYPAFASAIERAAQKCKPFPDPARSICLLMKVLMEVAEDLNRRLERVERLLALKFPSEFERTAPENIP